MTKRKKYIRAVGRDDNDLLIVKNIPCLFSVKGSIYQCNIYWLFLSYDHFIFVTRVDIELLYKGGTIFYSENGLKCKYIPLYFYFRNACVVLQYVVLITNDVHSYINSNCQLAYCFRHHMMSVAVETLISSDDKAYLNKKPGYLWWCLVCRFICLINQSIKDNKLVNK